MIKALMMVIRVAITQGVITLPFKRNIVLRFIMERVRETMKDALTLEKGGYCDH
jgi:hypothetical protein